MSLKLKDKVALITGASSGIGAAVAKKFASEGAHVILVARSVGGLEEVDDEIQNAGGSATLVPLDLLDTAAIDGLAMPLYERWKKLDIFVGNAGMVGKLMPTQQYVPDLWENVFRLNVHANQRLIRALDPLLRQSEAGRALFVTSHVAHENKQFWSAYAASKAALEVIAKTYANEVAKTNLRVNLIDPGPTRTRLRSLAYPAENPEDHPLPETKAQMFLDAVLSEENGVVFGG
ncbi:SDR family NAD(P)-dependent oxidoreductase [Sneathiella chungangensis]|uniref:SDR family NAD(P)-dependent oxidoreductase n=1 Tax=Sneathiella chungangensis TaxID=1418234 RepID=A0A845MDW6_9PROT|nr:SDR family NAD(P)-dependent oxidoreductase [Sneathiella chungangensis]MZR21427.1 SDR family NAD(P)-dependent oxidoreductase [Sneathiella chungangensis]